MTDRGDTEYGKRVLVEISHAIERFALAADPGTPLVAIGLFQRGAYFEPARQVYADIAARGNATVVGMVDPVPAMPTGVRCVALPVDGPLSREWSVTVLGAGGGATLVATDQERVEPGAPSLEDGRRFRGRWSFRRADAYGEVLRLRTQLRLPSDAAEEIDAVLQAVLAAPEPVHQRWWDVPLRFLAERVDHTVRVRDGVQQRLDAALSAPPVDGPAADRDPRTGLHTPRFLGRWTAGLGAGLPVGLVLLRVPGLADLRVRYGLRAELAALHGVAQGLGELVGDVDRVVRLDREEFLLVLPSWTEERVLALCEAACARVSQLDQQFPFVALPGTAAAVVTRERPLPVERLRRQIDGAAHPVATLTP